MHLKILSAKWQPFCSGGDELKQKRWNSSAVAMEFRLFHIWPLIMKVTDLKSLQSLNVVKLKCCRFNSFQYTRLSLRPLFHFNMLPSIEELECTLIKFSKFSFEFRFHAWTHQWHEGHCIKQFFTYDSNLTEMSVSCKANFKTKTCTKCCTS